MSRPFVLDPLFQATKSLTGVGPRIAKLLERTAGARVIDLLWMLPVAMVDRRATPKISDLQAGQIASLTIKVEEHIPPKSRSLPYRVRCTDSTGFIDLVFFHVKGDYLEHQLPIGEARIVSGGVEFFHGTPQMPHPDIIARLEDKENVLMVEPVYPLTAGLTNKMTMKIMKTALPRAPDLVEWIDSGLIKREAWPPWKDALKKAHHPQSEDNLSPHDPARLRLAYDELLANQLTIGLVRLQQKKSKGRPLIGNAAMTQKARAALPFKLTGSQEESIAEIQHDLQKPERMLRLLQGDVGSGKTAVAFLSMIHAIGSGGQSVLMAPTEILARQHEKTISRYAQDIGLSVVTLTGRDKGKNRDSLLQKISSGDANIVIGTHALFQEGVTFKDLALIVIDEQHRFGVHQRLQLSDKGNLADVLVMTATPIPRTLTMTVYGDMDVSRLTEKPAGRQPIDTRLISNERMEEVVAGLQRKIATKARVYWVCPLIEESEKLDLAAAEERHRDLQQTFGKRVGLLHGRMKPAEKDAVMLSFSKGDIDVLVSTTVIEVGIDVPEAAVMVIEHAERFGLSQLHQLRGRIGRGQEKSTCLLLYNPHINEIAKKRLTTIRDTEDGFVIAEEDLKLRGAGEVLGTRQSGLPTFRLANPESHEHLIKIAFDDARVLLDKDPQLVSPRGQAARTLLYLFERDTAIKYLRSG